MSNHNTTQQTEDLRSKVVGAIVCDVDPTWVDRVRRDADEE